MQNKIGDHAVVLGAGMGGLLAARVLADGYERVTVVERDRLPDGPGNRRGVPQGRHVHALLPGGAKVLGELFPGLLEQLVAAGAPVIEDYREFHFAPGGHRLAPLVDPGELVYQPSRPLLENRVRERVRGLPNVTFRAECDVVGLSASAQRDRVTGVRVLRHADGSAEEVLSAALVVDAMGRGARMPAWLEELGYARPAEEEVAVGVRYVSQVLRLRPGAIGERAVLIGATTDRPTGLALFANEDDTWLLTVVGYRGHHSEPSAERMVEFIEDFAPAHVTAALQGAQPLSEVASHRFPANRRRRYDRMSRFPAGLLVFADAMCSFNPVYGQGMSVAALEALTLRDCLRRGERDLARRFFRAAAKPIDVAWQLAVGADLALPYVEGPRPLAARIANSYVERLLRAAEHDPVVAARFMRVMALLDSPPTLMRPSTIARVVAGSRRAAAETKVLEVAP